MNRLIEYVLARAQDDAPSAFYFTRKKARSIYSVSSLFLHKTVVALPGKGREPTTLSLFSLALMSPLPHCDGMENKKAWSMDGGQLDNPTNRNLS